MTMAATAATAVTVATATAAAARDTTRLEPLVCFFFFLNLFFLLP